MRLTRNGWAAIGIAIAAFSIGRVFGIIELFVLGTGVLVLVVLAVITVNRRVPRLVVRRAVQPLSVTAGEAARVDIQIANAGQRRSPLLQLWEPVGKSGGATMNLAPLRRRETASAAYRLPSASRGVLVIGPTRARRRDVLGLCSRSFILAGTAELLVAPRHRPASFSLHGSHGRLGDHIRMKAYGQSGSEFHSLREYVTGDDLRRISWKASARTNGLMVKETALEGLRRCTVVLDTDAEQYDSASFERAVSAAASVVTGAIAAQLVTRLVTRDVDLRGPDVASTSLRWLASANATPLVETFLPSLKAAEGMGIVVLVTGSVESRCAATVRADLVPEDTLILVVTHDATARSTRGFVLDATEDDGFDGAWSSLTGVVAASPGVTSTAGVPAAVPASYGASA